MKKVIFHIDVNSAFLSWEAVYRLKHQGGKRDLRKEIAAVGGDIAMRHGIILAKSIPAARLRIKTGETIVEAKQKCPSLILVPPNYNLYERCSAAFMEILRSYTPEVEQYSIDEAFADMTGTETLWGPPLEAAHRMRRQIKRELGFTVNIGISENKLLAKMAGDFQKPDKVHTLWKSEIKEKMWGLPVTDLFFVGRATARKLHTLGIHTIGELAAADADILKYHLKKHGEVIRAFANGIDVSVVEPKAPPNKGYGNSTTIAFDVTRLDEAKLVLLALSETVAARLRADKVQTEVLAVGIKNQDFTYVSHQMRLPAPTDITKEIYRYARRLFEESWNGMPVRHLGIHAGRIQEESDIRQRSLFDTEDYPKLRRLDATIDRIRGRYGNDAVKRAAFAGKEGRIDHMSGGISREKRSVDYEKIKVE